jgi:hypothetical protein
MYCRKVLLPALMLPSTQNVSGAPAPLLAAPGAASVVESPPPGAPPGAEGSAADPARERRSETIEATWARLRMPTTSWEGAKGRVCVCVMGSLHRPPLAPPPPPPPPLAPRGRTHPQELAGRAGPPRRRRRPQREEQLLDRGDAARREEGAVLGADAVEGQQLAARRRRPPLRGRLCAADGRGLPALRRAGRRRRARAAAAAAGRRCGGGGRRRARAARVPPLAWQRRGEPGLRAAAADAGRGPAGAGGAQDALQGGPYTPDVHGRPPCVSRGALWWRGCSMGGAAPRDWEYAGLGLHQMPLGAAAPAGGAAPRAARGAAPVQITH